jgi:hypothetical protein
VPAQDGDEEGILKMDRPPTVSEAEAIRRYVGVSNWEGLSIESISKEARSWQRD